MESASVYILIYLIQKFNIPSLKLRKYQQCPYKVSKQFVHREYLQSIVGSLKDRFKNTLSLDGSK